MTLLKQIPLFENEFIPPTGEQLRDAGINKAINHANSVTENWGDKAYVLFLQFIVDRTNFKCEDFREWVKDKIDEPPSNRAFGAVIVRAAKAGKIKRIGFVNVTNPKAHKTPVSFWSKK